MEEVHPLTKEQDASSRCYLAVSDLAAYALDGRWLIPDCLVESARIWLARLTISTEAHVIAKAVLESELKDRDAARPEQLFTDAMTVNYASAVVARIWRRCHGPAGV